MKIRYFSIAVFSIVVLALCSCKNGSISTEPSGETRLLKISAKETTISKGDVIVTVGDRVFQKGELSRGIRVPFNASVNIKIETSIPEAAVFWSGKKLHLIIRGVKNFLLVWKITLIL